MDHRITLVTTLKDTLSCSLKDSMTSTPAVREVPPVTEQIESRLLIRQIQNTPFFLSSTKHLRIRLEKWLQYLKQIDQNKIWMQSKNRYLKLLHLMCYCECLLEPFTALPPQGSLPTLSKQQTTVLIDQVERQIKSQSNSRKNSILNIVNSCQQEKSAKQYESLLYQAPPQRFQTQASYGCLDQQSTMAMPLKNSHNNPNKNEPTTKNQTLPIQKTIYLPLKAASINNQRTFATEQDQKPIASILPNKSKQKTVAHKDSSEKENKTNFQYQKRNSLGNKSVLINQKRRNSASKFNPLQDKKNRPLKKQPSKPPTYPSTKRSSLHPKQHKLAEPLTSQNQKEYWQQKSNNSAIMTPNYLRRQGWQDEEECLEIVSYRDKEQEECDCTQKLLGHNWLAKILGQIV